MQPRRYLWLTLLLWALIGAGCGGSGSSGFDAIPSQENAAIEQALTERRCVDFEGLSVCPADQSLSNLPGTTPTPAPFPTLALPTPSSTAIPGGTPGSVPTPPSGVGINTAVGGANPTQCVAAASSCSFALPFAPQGFPPTAVFRVAVRRDADANWTVGLEPEATGSPSAPSYDATIPVDIVPVSPGPVSVQVAVLVFLHTPPVDLRQVQTLAQSGADLAFVTPEFQIQPAPAS